jgi:hypothetical protein
MGAKRIYLVNIIILWLFGFTGSERDLAYNDYKLYWQSDYKNFNQNSLE